MAADTVYVRTLSGDLTLATNVSSTSGADLVAAARFQNAGAYTIAATYTDASGKQTKLSTYVEAEVESVTVGSDGLYLNLKGLGAAPLDYVLQIGRAHV